MKPRSQLFRNTLIYSFTNLFLKSASFLLLPFYSHYVTPAEFGIYSVLIAGYTIIVSFYQGGFQSAFSKFYLEAENEVSKKAVLSQFFTMTMITSLFAALLCAANSDGLSRMLFSSTHYSSVIVVLALTLFFDNFQTSALHVYKTREEAKPAAYYSVVPAVINVALSLFLLITMRQGMMAIVNAQFISVFAVSALLLPKMRDNFSFQFERRYVVPFIKFALPLMLAGVFTALTDLADRFILKFWFDDTTVGIYSFSYRIANVMMLFVISFRTAWTPHAIRMHKREDYADHFGRSFLKLLFLSTTIFLCVSLLAPLFFAYPLIGEVRIFNPAYSAGVLIIPIIMLAYLFNGIVSFYSVGPYITGKSYHFLVSDGIAVIINIGGNLLLIPKLGLRGAALATFLSYLFSMIYMWAISKENVKVNLDIWRVSIFTTMAMIVFMIGTIYSSPMVVVLFLFLYFYWGARLMGFTIIPGLEKINRK